MSQCWQDNIATLSLQCFQHHGRRRRCLLLSELVRMDANERPAPKGTPRPEHTVVALFV